MQLVGGWGVIQNRSGSNFSGTSHSVSIYRCSLELSTFEYGCNGEAAFQGGEETEAKKGALMSNLRLISHR